MEISLRAQSMPESPIRKLAKYADEAKLAGVHVYHLNIGQPDIQTPPQALEAVKNFKQDILAYSPSQGLKSLRTKMVSYYAAYGIDLSPDEIIITSGGSEAIMFAYMSCLNPGDEIIVTDPSYANYMAFAISAGAVVKSVKTDIKNGFKLPPVEEFEKQITPKTRAILICNPNNPTGYLYTKQEMRQIRDLVKKYNLYLISDEVYREFIYTKSPYISACHLEGIEQNVILVDSVSKRYSECGIRIGALITKNKAVREAVMKFCQARLSPPLFGQIVAEASLSTPEEYMQEVYDEYLTRRNFLIDQLNQIPGVNLDTIGDIPFLAKGGTVYSGSAVVGDAGPEILTVAGGKATVTPLTATVDGRSLAQAIGSQVYRTNVQVSFTGSLSQLATVLQPAIVAETERIGGSFTR